MLGSPRLRYFSFPSLANSNGYYQFIRVDIFSLPCHQVARDAVLRFRPQINIRSYHANVKNPEFDVDFFKQFDVVLNGLDNLDARRHVNRLCLAADVPLVESGTTGFLGQVLIYLKQNL